MVINCVKTVISHIIYNPNVLHHPVYNGILEIIHIYITENENADSTKISFCYFFYKLSSIHILISVFIHLFAFLFHFWVQFCSVQFVFLFFIQNICRFKFLSTTHSIMRCGCLILCVFHKCYLHIYEMYYFQKKKKMDDGEWVKCHTEWKL